MQLQISQVSRVSNKTEAQFEHKLLSFYDEFKRNPTHHVTIVISPISLFYFTTLHFSVCILETTVNRWMEGKELGGGLGLLYVAVSKTITVSLQAKGDANTCTH